MTLIFFIIFSIIVFGLLFLFSIINGITSLFRKPSFSGNGRSSNYTSSSEHANANSKSNYPHRKIFSKDEGEYVNYEEIKD
ncbi:MAG: DUF4834 family protein [Dysgonomonas sp.]|nr:DUF4834 family protein [Dysgonomonas sp.]